MAKFHDFSGYSNFGGNPARAKQLEIASKIDLDEIEGGMNGPAGGCGFRSGLWARSYRGESYTFFDSIPHGMELCDQVERIKIDCALHIAGIQSGYIKGEAESPKRRQRELGDIRWND